MSEDNTTPAEGPTEAPQAPSLGVNDLKVMANIIEVVSNRGAIRANEMAAVGNVYNILMNFLIVKLIIDSQPKFTYCLGVFSLNLFPFPAATIITDEFIGKNLFFFKNIYFLGK